MPNYSNYAYGKGGGVRVWTNGFAINEPSFYGYVFLENTVVNYNLGKFTGKTYRSIVTGQIYYQIEASFNKTSGLSSITQGERAWVWAYDLFTQPYGSPDVTTNDTKKYSPPNEPQTKPSTEQNTNTTKPQVVDFAVSKGGREFYTPSVANVRKFYDRGAIIRTTKAGERVWVRPDLVDSSGYMPMWLGVGQGYGVIHKTVAFLYTGSNPATNPPNPNYVPIPQDKPKEPTEGSAGDGADNTYLFGAVALGLLILTGGKSSLF